MLDLTEILRGINYFVPFVRQLLENGHRTIFCECEREIVGQLAVPNGKSRQYISRNRHF